MNVNIFLKQFKRPNEEIVQFIKDGKDEEFGEEKLKGLLKILPEDDEAGLYPVFVCSFDSGTGHNSADCSPLFSSL